MTSPAPPPTNRLPTSTAARSTEPSPYPTSEDVELDHVQNGEAKTPLRLEEDLMQCARLGETGLIKKLFDAGKFDAKYKDEEGITPLHVLLGHIFWAFGESANLPDSGRRSITNMRHANFSSTQALMSMHEEGSQMQRLPCGPRNDVITMSSTFS
jgi:hypothetical protein